MSEQFDKKLINKINEVFENFEDDSANNGWEELRKKFPEKSKSRRGLWWFSSAAAILLIMGVWFYSDSEKLEVVKLSKPAFKTTAVDTTNLLSKAVGSFVENKPAASVKSAQRIKKTSSQAKRKVTFVHKADLLPQTAQEFRESGSEHDLTIMALSSPASKNETEPELEGVANATKNQSTPIAQSTHETENKEVFPSEVISREQLSKLIRPEGQEKAQKNKKFSFAFFAGSYFTYANGSETSMNTGAGISSELKISKKVRLSTGLSLGQNSLKYEKEIPREATANFGRAGNRDGRFNEYYAVAAQDALASSYRSTLTISSYDARLLGFDIPINIKYLLLQKKNTLYLSTGFSSNFFISESYTYDYSYKNAFSLSSQEPEQEDTNRFQSVDFARILNFSIGLEHTLNKKTRLSFEPFVKYPLSGLGSHDLRFGAAGMNIKFNFNH
ncbi:MAG: hypothetical protein H7Y13_09270 [Sphingobacteriaceae bacterium]|nr:hypothetical protein [Sphingobacteriaceae bacterium]